MLTRMFRAVTLQKLDFLLEECETTYQYFTDAVARARPAHKREAVAILSKHIIMTALVVNQRGKVDSMSIRECLSFNKTIKDAQLKLQQNRKLWVIVEAAQDSLDEPVEYLQ